MTAKRAKSKTPEGKRVAEAKRIAETKRGGKMNVKHAIDMILSDYFNNLNGQKPRNIHQMIIGYVEHRLIENTMQRTQRNQSQAAEMLGMSRSTLRTKLDQYQIARRKKGKPSESPEPPK